MHSFRTLPCLAAFAQLALSACDQSAEIVQHVPAPSDPQLTLFVSNQSFDMDLVDIRLEIDGQLMVSGDFEVGSQHSWKQFELPAAPGTHTLRVTSADSHATIDASFVMDDRKWMVVSFWYEDGIAYLPRFDWMLADSAPGFD